MTTASAAQQKIRMKKVSGVSREIARRSHALYLIVTVGLLVTAIVFMSAFSANLRRVNNELMAENEYIQAEIDTLQSRIGDACSVGKIEQIATEEFGMVHPDADRCIALGKKKDTKADLAATIKDEAYD